jgi:hypothetical protein
MSGTLASNDTHQDEQTVRFKVKDTENEPINNIPLLHIFDENNNLIKIIYSSDLEIKLPNGTYSYTLYINSLCQLTDFFTIKDGDKEITIVLNKVQFHFSEQNVKKTELRIVIKDAAGDPYTTVSVDTDSTGYSFIYLLPGAYTYKVRQGIELAEGQFQVFSNLTQDVTIKITGFCLHEFFLRTSTGKIITRASVYIYDTNKELITNMYSDDKGVCRIYLPNNQSYNYAVHVWDAHTQIDMGSFTLNGQNFSTTVIFYPITFKLRKSDGSKFGITPCVIFNNSYSCGDFYETDENSDPVIYLPSGHYTYMYRLDSSYPVFEGKFDVDTSSLVVNYIDQTHEITFEFKDREGNNLQGGVSINGSYVNASTWWGEVKPLSIHLPDGEYDCLISSSCGFGINKKLIVAGKDTTIVINHHKMIIKISNNKNETLDFYASMATVTGNTVTLKKIDVGTYSIDVLNGSYKFNIASYDIPYSDRIMPERIVTIQDMDTTVNVILNQCRISVKTAEGNIVNDAHVSIKNENNEYRFDGSGKTLFYLTDGRYTYYVRTSRNYYEITDVFEVNKEDKEMTLFAYPATFKVLLSNQLPLLNYDLSFNGYYTQPDQKDEYSSKYLLIQGEYEYEVSAKSLLGNSISNKGKVKMDGSKEIPITFYSLEASVMIDGKPATGSKIRLWQGDYQYDNEVSLYANEEGKVKDYVSNGLYHYVVEPLYGGNSYSGSFSADSQNVNINANFYTVRFFTGKSSINYNIYIKNTDSGEEIWVGPEWNNTIVTTRLTPGHYVYNVCYNYTYYYYNPTLAEGAFTIDNKPVDIDESFFPYHFIISNPSNKYIYEFVVRKNNTAFMLDTYYFSNMDTITYYLPKGEYSYECYGSMSVSGNFKVENPSGETYIYLDNVGLQTIDIEDDSNFKIYPNPADDMIWFDPLVDGEITISTMDGKTILHQTLYQQENLNISQLGKGIYIVKINDNRNLRTILRKLVVE